MVSQCRESNRAAATARKPSASERSSVVGERLDLVGHVKVRLTVTLGTAELTIDKLFSLAANDVVSLDRDLEAPVDVRLNDKIIARGSSSLSATTLACASPRSRAKHERRPTRTHRRRDGAAGARELGSHGRKRAAHAGRRRHYCRRRREGDRRLRHRRRAGRCGLVMLRRRCLPRFSGAPLASGALRVVERASLGPATCVHLVQVDGGAPRSPRAAAR